MGAFVSGLGVVLPLLGRFITTIIDNKPLLVASLIAIGVVALAVLGPGALIAIAIVALITAIGFLAANWRTIWDTIVEKLKGAGDSIVSVLKTTWDIATRNTKNGVNLIIGFINKP